jgi:16S rRNA (guanine(527)-N(7))-methyltransferase RsmG
MYFKKVLIQIIILFKEKKNIMKDITEKILSNYNFSEKEKNQFHLYLSLLCEENKKYNLTRIEEPEEMCYRHIIDATTVNQFHLLDQSKIILDIGSGCGVPGIILAIQHPEKSFFLMEVNQKKINFLYLVIEALNLTNTTLITDDFLTFIHKSKTPVDTFLARASLPLREIIKLYLQKRYSKSTIIYWAGPSWKENSNHNVVLEPNKFNVQEFFYPIFRGIGNSPSTLSYVQIKKN